MTGREVHLGCEAHARVQRMADTMHVSVEEATRRGYILLDLYLSLLPGEQLGAIHEDGMAEAFRMNWDAL